MRHSYARGQGPAGLFKATHPGNALGREQRGGMQMVDLLLKKGADVRAKDTWGNTAVSEAERVQKGGHIHRHLVKAADVLSGGDCSMPSTLSPLSANVGFSVYESISAQTIENGVAVSTCLAASDISTLSARSPRDHILLPYFTMAGNMETLLA
jgi:hypothetical protein